MPPSATALDWYAPFAITSRNTLSAKWEEQSFCSSASQGLRPQGRMKEQQKLKSFNIRPVPHNTFRSRSKQHPLPSLYQYRQKSTKMLSNVSFPILNPAIECPFHFHHPQNQLWCLSRLAFKFRPLRHPARLPVKGTGMANMAAFHAHSRLGLGWLETDRPWLPSQKPIEFLLHIHQNTKTKKWNMTNGNIKRVFPAEKIWEERGFHFHAYIKFHLVIKRDHKKRSASVTIPYPFRISIAMENYVDGSLHLESCFEWLNLRYWCLTNFVV